MGMMNKNIQLILSVLDLLIFFFHSKKESVNNYFRIRDNNQEEKMNGYCQELRLISMRRSINPKALSFSESIDEAFGSTTEETRFFNKIAENTNKFRFFSHEERRYKIYAKGNVLPHFSSEPQRHLKHVL